jgi:hypothetical protein
MKKQHIASSCSCILIALVFCGCDLREIIGREAASSVEVPYVAGRLTLPSGCTVAPSDLTIYAGISGESRTSIQGEYALPVHAGSPVLAFATSSAGSPMLANIFAADSAQNDLNADTTAQTITFMGLGLFTEDPKTWKYLRALIAAVPEVGTFAELLQTKLALDPQALALDPPDAEIVAGLDAALAASVDALQASSSRSAKASKSIAAKSAAVSPEAESGLSFSVNSMNEIVATNTKLRFVNVTINGPSANGIETLVSPCLPPLYLLLPNKTTLNPKPLSVPPLGSTHTYWIRACGGLDNCNLSYNPAVDSDSLIKAVSYSGVINLTAIFAKPFPS